MQHEEIVTRLSQIAVSPSEVVYAITMQNVLSEIAKRMGEDALELSVEELNQACEEGYGDVLKSFTYKHNLPY